MHPQYITLSKLAKDITEQRFGRLIALGPVARSASKKVMWRCTCDCGNITVVSAQDLRKGATRSCGCLYKEDIGRRSKTRQ